MHEQQNQNIYDSMHLILVLIQTNELVLHVIDIDTKKSNFNSYQIHMYHVNYVIEQGISLKSFELHGDEKQLVKY